MGIREQYVETLKNAAITMATGSAVAALTAKYPIFAAPVLQVIVKELINSVVSYLVNQGELRAFFVYIDLRTNQQGRDFYQAVINWQTAPTPEEKALREKEFKTAFRNLVVLTS